MFFATVEIRVQTAEHLLICSYLYIRTVVSIMSYMSYLKFFIAILFKKCNVQYNTIILQVFVSHFYLMSTKFLYPWITKVSFLSNNLCSVHLFFRMLYLFMISLLFLGSSNCMRIVDLTHEQSISTIFWPGNPQYNFTILFRNFSGSYW